MDDRSELTPKDAQTPAATVPPTLLFALTALAGATAGGFSVAHGRHAEDIVGASAPSAVAAASFLAAALGAVAFGTVAGRAKRPLFAAGVLTAAAALLTLIIPSGLGALRGLAPSPLNALGVWIAFGPAAFAGGGALAFTLRAMGSSGSSLPLGAAALGFALGRWVAAFGLVPDTGLDAVQNVSLALGLALGLGTAVYGRGLDRLPEAGAPGASRAATPGTSLFAAALLGAAGFGWWRLAAREFDNLAGPTASSAWAFGALFTALLGLGLLASGLGRPARTERPPVVAPTLGALIACTAGIAFVASGPTLGILLGELGQVRTNAGSDALLLALGSAAVAAPALGIALVFGALAAHPSATRRCLAAAALGAVITSLALELTQLPHRTLLLRAPLAAVAAAVLIRFAFAPGGRPGLSAGPLAGGLIGLAAVGLTLGASPPGQHPLGDYLGQPQLRIDLLGYTSRFQREHGSGDVRAFARDAFAPKPAYNQAPNPALFLDGVPVDAAPSNAALTWLPRLLNPSAKQALIGGLGSGAIPRGLVELGPLDIVCAEPRPALAEAVEELGGSGTARVDARDLRGLLAAEDPGGSPSYDLILVDAGTPWRRGMTSQLSAEFFLAAGQRLTPSGLVAVAIPTEQLMPTQVASIARTGLSVFPDGLLVDATPRDTSTAPAPRCALLVFSPRGALPRAQEIDTAQALVDASPAALAALPSIYGTADVKTLLIERIWLGVEQLRTFTAQYSGGAGTGELLSDGTPGFEQATFRLGLMGKEVTSQWIAPSTERALFAACDLEFRRKLFSDWRATTDQLDALRPHKTRYLQAQNLDDRARGLALARLGLAYDPDDPEFKADLLLFGEAEPELFEIERERLLRRSPRETFRLGLSLAQAGRTELARNVLGALVEAYPASVIALGGLAGVQDLLGESEAAAATRARMAELDPLSDALR